MSAAPIPKMPENGRAACVGQWELFDSTNAYDHRVAREICASCNVRAWCEARADILKEQNRQHCRPLTGTWAGKIYGRTTPPPPLSADKRALPSRLRVASEDSTWTDDAALVAHAAYEKARADDAVADLDEDTRTGERVYQRRKKRNQLARRRSA